MNFQDTAMRAQRLVLVAVCAATLGAASIITWPAHVRAASASAAVSDCLLFTSPANDAPDTTTLGSGQNLDNLDIVAGSALALGNGGFTAQIQVKDLSYQVPQDANELFLAFHWSYANPANSSLYAGVRIPSQAAGAPADSADFEFGGWDPSTDTYAATASTTGRLNLGVDGTIDIDVPAGSFPLGIQSHPAQGDYLENVFANSYSISTVFGQTQIDRGPKKDGSAGATYAVGGSCSSVGNVPPFQWQFTPPASPRPRQEAAMTYDAATASVVLFGGNPMQAAIGELNDTWTFDGSRWTRVFTAHSPPARRAASMAYDAATQTVLLFGGHDAAGDTLGDMWSWDGTDWTQLQPAHLPPARSYAAMSYDAAHQQLVLFGGASSSSATYLDDTWLYSAGDWTQVLLSPQPTGRAEAAMAYDARDSVTVLFGGAGEQGSLNDTWTWDGSMWTMQVYTGTLPAARSGHAMAYDAALGKVVMTGGSVAPDTWTWDLTSGWTQFSGATQPDALYLGLAFDASNQTLYEFSGTSNAHGHPDFRLYQLTSAGWSLVDVGALEPRYEPAFTYDPTIGKFVLFGGYSVIDGSLDDTWTFDGSTWTQLHPAHSPPAVYQAQFAYEGTSGDLVLFGGCCASRTDETWLFDGTDWSQANPVSSPPGRGDGAFVWDPATQSDVLFGGVGSDITNDTWTWAHGTWTQQQPVDSPSARDRMGAAYDPTSGQVVVFSGFGGFRCVADQNGNDYCTAHAPDTWTWNGNDWTQAATGVLPPGREQGAMAYDPTLGGVVLYGGFSEGGLALDDSWLFRGGTWQPLSPLASPDPGYGGRLASAPGGPTVYIGGLYDNQTWTITPENPVAVAEAPSVASLAGLGVMAAAAVALRRRRRRGRRQARQH